MAYAAVISLKHTIQYLMKPQIARFAYEDLESVGYILKRLDGSSNKSINRSAINALDAEIREAVCKLEDALQSYLLYGSLPLSRGLQREIDSFSKIVRNLKAEYLRELDSLLPVKEDDDVSPTDDFGGNKSTTVGLSDQFEQIRNELLDLQSGSKTVSLVGMAGIGKTHLAREIYQHPIVLQHFDFRVWVKVGPQQQVKNVWVEVVAQVEGKPRNLYMETNIITLVEVLEKNLRGRGRCLIVLDDIWSTKVCDSLIRLLRADGNERRLLLTTRLEEVAKYHSTSIHQIRFLNNEESWKLLQQNVFGDKYFPPQLEKAGRKIAENCEGLPLLILTIADILCGLEKTEEYWNKVADSKTTTFTDAYDKIEKVLFSSYEYLPQYLKACFLYMGVFPQKSEIPLPKLINLWTVEDVLEPESDLTRTRNPPETRVARISKRDLFKERIPSIDSYIDYYGVARTSVSVALLEPKPSETGVARISENVALFELMPIENCVQRTSKRKYFRTCRYKTMRPLEKLYLLEPGPSPTRFIKPWKKSKLWDSKLCLTRELWSPNRKLPLTRVMGTSVAEVKRTPKKFAMECLKKLFSNSLAIVCKQSSNNRIKSCKLHSAYWHLCVKEARSNKFFHVLKKLTDGSKDYMESQRRLSVQNNMLFGIKEVYDSMAATLTARSLLCTGPDHEYPVPICLNLMLLKVLDALAIRFYDFPTEVVKLLELRYLALTHNGKLPSSISMLQELQYLIVRQHHNIKLLRDSTGWPEEICDMLEVRSTKFLRDSTCLPKEIWDMEELVYLRIMGSNLPDPSKWDKLPNLLTLYVNSHSCTKAVFRSIPYLKKLGIIIELLPDGAETLSCFQHIILLERLHSLKCVIVNPRQRSKVVAPPDRFLALPSSLKKLSLNGIGYSWEYMGVIGSLPSLQVLKLRSAFHGPVWITMAEEFQSLEFLLLEDIDLVHWTTDDDDDCFPSLQCLIIRHCYKLKEIPLQIGSIPTLKRMEVVDCSPSVVASAQQIQEKRNSSLQVVINSSWNL